MGPTDRLGERYEARIADLERRLAEAAWRPIETCPRCPDAQYEILEASWRGGAWEMGEMDVGEYRYDPGNSLEGEPGYYGWFSNFGRCLDPTHWRPHVPPTEPPPEVNR